MTAKTSKKKTKNKYNQSGGLQPANIKGHPNFGIFNLDALKNIILNPENNNENGQFESYEPLLKSLLVCKDNIINMEFINNFYRYLYYSTTNDNPNPIANINFDIKFEGGVYSFDNPELVDYKITSSHTQPHGNTSILFLKKKDGVQNNKPDKLVLKIFNNLIVDFKDYLSLDVNVVKNPDSKVSSSFTNPRYNVLKIEDYNTIDFNCVRTTHLINTQDKGDKVILSCRNNDAINDYIINLILQYIKKNGKPNGTSASELKFVKYYNLCCLNIKTPGTVYGYSHNQRYCIIMEQTDGDITKYIKKMLGVEGPFDLTNGKFNTARRDHIDKINYILTETERLLDMVKSEEYMFTHTDMKLGNLFYNGITDDKPNIILADFDKSSITFNGIRFYNDINQAPGSKSSKTFKSLMGNSTSPIGQYLMTKSVADDAQERLVKMAEKETHLYKTVLKYTTTINVETEQIFMRYNYTPYYLSFDMVSLILSLIGSGIFNGKLYSDIRSLEFGNFISKYICDSDDQNSFNVFYNVSSSIGLKENFGEMLSSMWQNKSSENIRFKNNFNYNVYRHISQLYITTNSQKVALSLPYIPLAVEYLGSTAYKFDSVKTHDDLQAKNVNSDLIAKYRSDNYSTIIAEYIPRIISSGIGVISKLSNALLSTYIISTNRYSNNYIIYDYDNIENISTVIVNIITFVSNINNLNQYFVNDVNIDFVNNNNNNNQHAESSSINNTRYINQATNQATDPATNPATNSGVFNVKSENENSNEEQFFDPISSQNGGSRTHKNRRNKHTKKTRKNHRKTLIKTPVKSS